MPIPVEVLGLPLRGKQPLREGLLLRGQESDRLSKAITHVEPCLDTTCRSYGWSALEPGHVQQTVRVKIQEAVLVSSISVRQGPIEDLVAIGLYLLERAAGVQRMGLSGEAGAGIPIAVQSMIGQPDD